MDTEKNKNIAQRKAQPPVFRAGFTLFYAVLVSSLLLAIGLAILNITFKEFVLSSAARESELAFYAADTALECALYWDRSSQPFGNYGDSLSEGLVGFWRFEDSAGGTLSSEYAVDSSGHGNLGYLNTPSGPTWLTDGSVDNALSFDGVDDYLATADLSGIDPGNTPFTVTAWIRVDALPTVRSWVLLLGDTGAGALHWLINGASNSEGYLPGQMQIGVWGGVQAHPVLSVGVWTHIATVYDGSNLTVYVNGSPTSEGSQSATFNLAGVPLGVAEKHSTANQSYFQGAVDEVRVYDHALSDEEVSTVYTGQTLARFNQPVPPDSIQISCAGNDINNATDPTVGWYTSPEGDGWIVTDTSGSGVTAYMTRFDILFSNKTCALVDVSKSDDGKTVIESKGYNTCEVNNPRRVERAIRARY